MHTIDFLSYLHSLSHLYFLSYKQLIIIEVQKIEKLSGTRFQFCLHPSFGGRTEQEAQSPSACAGHHPIRIKSLSSKCYNQGSGPESKLWFQMGRGCQHL